MVNQKSKKGVHLSISQPVWWLVVFDSGGPGFYDNSGSSLPNTFSKGNNLNKLSTVLLHLENCTKLLVIHVFIDIYPNC